MRERLRDLGVKVDLRADYHHGLVRNYRVSSQKMERVLGFRPKESIEDSVADMMRRIEANGGGDFENPRHYDFRWLQSLEEAHAAAGAAGSVLDAPTERIPQ